MSNKNKKTVVTMEDAKKVENQEKTPVTPIPDEKGEPTDKQEEGGKDEGTGEKEKKFHLPKIEIPKIPLPSKDTVINVLKGIALLLLGAITGAVAIVAAAIRVSSAEKAAVTDDEEEEIVEEDDPEEEDIPDETEAESETE